MKKKISPIKGLISLSILILIIVGCDKDYTSIGANVIGDTNYSTAKVIYPAITYNKKLNPVQTNGLPSYYLGVYNDPVYGSTSASVVSQLTLSGTTTGINIQLDSVVLRIPYYSKINPEDPTDDEGNTNYIMDSIYGNVDEIGNSLSPMKLSVYRSNYFLRDFDPESNFESLQKYYSDRSTSEGSMIPISELESELIYESPSDDLFEFKTDQIILTEENDDGEQEETERQQPALRILLDTQFWKEKILDKINDTELSNVNNFKDYFRGIFIKLEEVSGAGSMGLLNMRSASIELHYRSISDADTDGDGIPDTYDADADNDGVIDEGKEDTDGDGIVDAVDVDQTEGVDEDMDGIDDDLTDYFNRILTLNFSGNIINFYDNNFSPAILTEINNSNTIDGDEKLYLKGGEGSMAVIDLFGGEDLDDIRNLYRDETNNEKHLRLINEANLVFYEDESIITDESIDSNHEFDRLYVYDIKNNIPLIDYQRDLIIAQSPNTSVLNHLGTRREDDLGRKKYKIRITEHIKNLIYNDSTNTKLGLVISNNVNVVDNASILAATADDELNKVPRGTILSPRGTVVYGNNAQEEEKRVKLEIFYTEPESE